MPPSRGRVVAHQVFSLLLFYSQKQQNNSQILQISSSNALILWINASFAFAQNNKIMRPYNIQMSDHDGEQSQVCYFCKESDIRSCVTRSLYHKYNDSSTKILRRIDEIIEVKKQRSNAARRFQEVKHLVDDSDHLSKYMSTSKARSELTDMLQYYKFRKFVPIFAKSLDNLSMTEELHVYYYDKLKLYYNQIKKKLNITVEQSSLSQSSHSFITKSQLSEEKSQILDQITTKMSKENIRQYETQSKALEDLMSILKKNQDRLKKIKSLRTQDCTKDPNPFKDNIQRKSNLINYLASESRAMAKKSKKVFFKYIQQAKAYRNVEQTNRIKSIKKLFGQSSSKNNTFYESIKLRSNSESIARLRKDNSKTNVANNQRTLFRNKALAQKSQRKSCQNLTDREIIKSLPKVQMNLNMRPTRSTSSTSINYPNHNHQITKKLIVRKQIDYAQQVQMIKQGHTLSDKKKKPLVKMGPKIQIDQNDNIATINRKKIQELKLKAQKKKQSRK